MSDSRQKKRFIFSDEAEQYIESRGGIELFLHRLNLMGGDRVILKEDVERIIEDKKDILPPKGVKFIQSYGGETERERDTLTKKLKGFQLLLSDRWNKYYDLYKKEFPSEIFYVTTTDIPEEEEIFIMGHLIDFSHNTSVKERKYLVLELEMEDGYLSCFCFENTGCYSAYLERGQMVSFMGKLRRRERNKIFLVEKMLCLPPPKNQPALKEENDFSIGFISDLHFGSKYFNAKAAEGIAQWMTSQGIEKNLKHVVVVGDGVEGVGIYPSQRNNLSEFKQTEQYNSLYRYFSRFPEDINIYFLPGNHDSVRLAEPQPPIPSIFSEVKDTRTYNLSNPSDIIIEGYLIKAYHGYGIFDRMEEFQNSETNEEPREIVLKAMQSIINRRSIGIGFKGAQKIAPYFEDRLFFDTRPNCFVIGHTHYALNSNCDNTLFINSSTFQNQTDYQYSLGVKPDIGLFTVLNASNNSCFQVNYEETTGEI